MAFQAKTRYSKKNSIQCKWICLGCAYGHIQVCTYICMYVVAHMLGCQNWKSLLAFHHQQLINVITVNGIDRILSVRRIRAIWPTSSIRICKHLYEFITCLTKTQWAKIHRLLFRLDFLNYLSERNLYKLVFCNTTKVGKNGDYYKILLCACFYKI